MPSKIHREEANKRYTVAFRLQEKGQFDKAAESFQSAIDWSKEKLKHDDSLVINYQSGLSRCLHKLEKYSDAIAIDRGLLRYWKDKDGLEKPETIDVQQDLADDLHNTGEYLEAALLNEESLSARIKIDLQKKRTRDSFETMSARDHLAGNYHELGRYEEATVMYQTNLDIQSSTLKEDDDNVLITRHNLALNLTALGNFKSLSRAENLHKENLAVLKRTKKQTIVQMSWVERGLRICKELIAEKTRPRESLQVDTGSKDSKGSKGERPRASSSSNIKIHTSKDTQARSKNPQDKGSPQPVLDVTNPDPKQKKSPKEKGVDASNPFDKISKSSEQVGRDLSPNEDVKRRRKPRANSDPTRNSKDIPSPVESNSGKSQAGPSKYGVVKGPGKTSGEASPSRLDKNQTESPSKSQNPRRAVPVIVISGKSHVELNSESNRHKGNGPSSSAPDISSSKTNAPSQSDSSSADKAIRISNSTIRPSKAATTDKIPPKSVNNAYLYSKLFESNENPDRADVNTAKQWWERFSYTKDFTNDWKKSGRIRIAIIDSGFDQGHPDFQHDDVKDHIRKWKSFVNGRSTVDLVGHGTHVLSVLLKIAPFADFYIARVVKSPDEAIQPENIAQAIRHVTQEWKVNIVNMSFGFSARHKCIIEAMAQVPRDPENPDDKHVLFFAAAANHGLNDGIAFPASQRDVFCINCTDGYGAIKGFTPASSGQDNSFSVLGAGVEGAWPIELGKGLHRHMSGTSFATPIAAGIAAMILEFERQNRLPKKIRQAEKLKSFEGMSLIMRKLMSKPQNESREKSYYYLRPWQLFDPNCGNEDMDARAKVVYKISEILDEEFKAQA